MPIFFSIKADEFQEVGRIQDTLPRYADPPSREGNVSGFPWGKLVSAARLKRVFMIVLLKNVNRHSPRFDGAGLL